MRRFFQAAMGGGTATAAFSPTSITGLQAWYKADAIVGLSDGDLIDSDLSRYWIDSSGNARDLAEETHVPTYKTAIINSLPIVRFIRASTTEMTIKTGQPALTAGQKPITMVAVFALNSTGVAMSLHGTDATSAGIRFQIGTNNNIRMIADATLVATSGTALTTGQWVVGVATYSATGAYAFYHGSTALASGTNDLTVSASNRRIGGTGTLGVTESCDMDVAELLQYDNVISSTDRGNLVSYLGTKYNL